MPHSYMHDITSLRFAGNEVGFLPGRANNKPQTSKQILKPNPLNLEPRVWGGGGGAGRLPGAPNRPKTHKREGKREREREGERGKEGERERRERERERILEGERRVGGRGATSSCHLAFQHEDFQ